MSEQLLPNIARNVALWFPELAGRSLAVSEADITEQNMPTLPLCMVALANVDAEKWVWQSAASRTELADNFMVEFWLESVKLRKADGSETPFWAFYNYEDFRDRLLTEIVRYVGPRGQRVEFLKMTVESLPYAVILSFQFRSHLKWCANEIPNEPGDGLQAQIDYSLCTPKTNYCGPAFEPTKEKDSCISA